MTSYLVRKLGSRTLRNDRRDVQRRYRARIVEVGCTALQHDNIGRTGILRPQVPRVLPGAGLEHFLDDCLVGYVLETSPASAPALHPDGREPAGRCSSIHREGQLVIGFAVGFSVCPAVRPVSPVDIVQVAVFARNHESHRYELSLALVRRTDRFGILDFQRGLPHDHASALFAKHRTRKPANHEAGLLLPRCLENLLQPQGKSLQVDDPELILFPAIDSGDQE